MAETKKTNKARPRTYARNRPAVSRRGYERVFETDGTYFLKLVICILLGTFWVKFSQPIVWFDRPLNGIPVGFLLGLLFISLFEKIQADRKIWYAVLIIVTILCYFAPAGIVI